MPKTQTQSAVTDDRIIDCPCGGILSAPAQLGMAWHWDGCPNLPEEEAA